MKRKLYSLFLGLTLICQAVSAQRSLATATIPFAFKVGDNTLPAGDYTIAQTNGLLRLGETAGSHKLMHLTMPATRRRASQTGKLQFTRYEDGYYLTTIWDANSTDGRAVVPSKHQRELAKHAKSMEIAEVLFPSPLQ